MQNSRSVCGSGSCALYIYLVDLALGIAVLLKIPPSALAPKYL